MVSGQAAPRTSGRAVAILTVATIGTLLAAVGGFALSGGGGRARVAASLAERVPNPLVADGRSEQSQVVLPRTRFGSATDAPAAPVPAAPAVTTPSAPTPAAAPIGLAPVIARVPTTERVIFLGIDDGLTRDPAVLDYLASNRIPFASFLVAVPLQADPEFWDRSRSIGGSIQAHTLNHPNLTRVAPDQVRRELCGSADLIQSATGVRPTLFRPPYGAYNDTVRAIATECGYAALVMWKGATNDGRVELQEQVLTPGDILLMHWRPDLLLNLQNVVALTKAQGFKIARIEDFVQPVP